MPYNLTTLSEKFLTHRNFAVEFLHLKCDVIMLSPELPVCIFEHPFGGLWITYDVRNGGQCKAGSGLHISVDCIGIR